MKACFASTDILLPSDDIDLSKWAVIACDQYTSQPDYWEKAEKIVGESPSALRIIFPEVYLEREDAKERIRRIQESMLQYLEKGVLIPSIKDGFVLVERRLSCGVRKGLVGCLDLEAYDFRPEKKALVRATEQTIASRIPPRVQIRQGAALESPHIMLLIDDPKNSLIEPLYEKRSSLKQVYDIELMLGGGHITGYAVEGEAAERLNAQLYERQKASDGFFLAVGDGNHSLATAKTCWEQLKTTLSETERENHPARYALVELVNLHDESLEFEPIHRVMFHTDKKTVVSEFINTLKEQGMDCDTGDSITFLDGNGREGYDLFNTADRIPVDVLQMFLDEYLARHKESAIDYVHGTDAVEEIVQKDNCVGIVLSAISKASLFPAIRSGGVLPRKTFSMGEAYEKRYYLECRSVEEQTGSDLC